MTEKNETIWYSRVKIEAPSFFLQTNFPGVSQSERLVLLREKRRQGQVLSKEEEAELQALAAKNVEIWRPYDQFKAISVVPDYLYSTAYRYDVYDALPPDHQSVFKVGGGGGIVVNAACAEILQRFRLGSTRLFPVRLVELASKNALNDQTYYFLNISEWRRYALPEASYRLEYVGYNGEKIKMYDVREQKSYFALKHTALECDIDLWHEPQFASSVFMTPALHEAMMDAGMEEGWGFRRCKLV